MRDAGRRRPRRAERARRRRAVRRRAARRSTRCTGSPTCPVADATARSAGTSLRLYARRARRPARRRRATAPSTRSPSTRGRVDFGLLDAHGRLLAEPGALPRRAPRRRRCERVLERVPAARALRAHRHPAAADQHGLRARRDGRRGRPGARGGAETLLLIPDLLPLLALRQHARPSSRTRRRRSASTRAPAAGRPICSSASTSRRALLPGGRRARARALGAAHAPASTDDRPRRRRGGRGRDARHRLRRRGGAVRSTTAPSFISAGTWSLVGVEVDAPVIDDAASRRT